MGTNDLTGPGMAGIFSRIPSIDWFKAFVKNPDAMKRSDAYAIALDKKYANNMSSFELSDCAMEAIISYLENPNRNK